MECFILICSACSWYTGPVSSRIRMRRWLAVCFQWDQRTLSASRRTPWRPSSSASPRKRPDAANTTRRYQHKHTHVVGGNLNEMMRDVSQVVILFV